MSFLRGEQDIDTSVRKAISPEETAPKRKHVRAIVVYTWDHRNGKQFWHAVRMLPLHNDSVMTFKALIVIHKVLHEGHRSVLKEAQHHVEWLRSLAKPVGPSGGYRRLIDEYVRLLLHKLEFHRQHPDFNGTFEYEEYISLRNVDDPNEGYEAVIDLMNLQDSIDDYRRLLFASLGASTRRVSGSGAGAMECKVSSLTAMVTESYGIYRFSTSMLRGLHQQSDMEVLEPLRSRYYSQHRRLRNFYFEAAGIKYLSTLISIPELPQEPPDLTQSNESAPQLPRRPRELASQTTGATMLSSAPTGTPDPIVPEATGNWWQGEQSQIAAQQAADAQRLAEEQQMRQLEEYQRQLEAERQHQAQLALQAQQQFEADQAALLAQQQQQRQQELAVQHQMQAQGEAAAREQELALLRSQQEEAQAMLQQYDSRVQSLESDLAQITSLTQQQIDAKSEQLQNLNDQAGQWRQKYEALAKLYSQLRHEHLELMSKYRKTQAKASSAQEAIEKREKAERDLKSKNLELADLIRERDRARYELDKSRGQHLDEIERLERSIALLNDKVSENDRSRAQDVSSLVTSHARQLQLLESQLAEKETALEQLGDSAGVLRAKDDEIDILKEQLGQTEEMLGSLSLNGNGAGKAGNVNSIIDAVLLAAYDQVQQSLSTFDSPLEGGNANATPPLVLSLSDSAVVDVETFADAFTQYVAEGVEEADPVSIITSASKLAGSMVAVLYNVKGLSGLPAEDPNSEVIFESARDTATNLCTFYSSLNSELLNELGDEDDKLELIITNHVEVLKHLQELSNVLEGMLPKTALLNGGSLDQQVDGAMAHLAGTVAEANQRLSQLLNNKYTVFDRQVNEAIIASAVAITSAISELIKWAIECQKEIVANGKEGESPENYYKKNHRWTEGLISAARAVGGATNILIETADGTLSGRGTPEQLIVSSREVASSIAQLVAASRVKAGYLSKTQGNLETASKDVTSACRSLVTKVEDILAKHRPDPKLIDYSQLTPMEFKSTSMEQQVEVLKLEQELNAARNRLFEIRKLEYVRQEEEEA